MSSPASTTWVHHSAPDRAGSKRTARVWNRKMLSAAASSQHRGSAAAPTQNVAPLE